MRKIAVPLLIAAALALSPSAGQSAPVDASAIKAAADAASPVEQARVYCYNRFSGRFLHWGSCGGRHYARHRSHPRVYCYNRYSGRFLHWGHC